MKCVSVVICYRVIDFNLSSKRESEVRGFIEAGREFQSLMAEPQKSWSKKKFYIV